MLTLPIKTLAVGEKKFVCISFTDHFDDKIAQHIIDGLEKIFASSNETISMIWECTNMADFDDSAKGIWISYFKSIKNRVEIIHLISDRLLIRSAARLIGIYLGKKISVWGHYNDFQESINIEPMSG